MPLISTGRHTTTGKISIMSNLPFAKKSLGQHWLTDAASLQAMCDAAEVSGTDTVLEIGPGLGTLTEVLVLQAQHIVAVEFDEKLARELPSRVSAENLSVIQHDILRFDLTKLPTGYKVVANIPYYLTSNLIRVLSESANPPSIAVLLVQKEVAERVAAKPGDMSLLSVTAQFYWEVSLGMHVRAKLFTPPPKVDSQILILHRRTEPLFPGVDTKAYFRVVKAGFAQRRKTLLNSLSAGLHLDRNETEQLLKSVGISPTARAQTLSLVDWNKLYESLTG
jgi:16S rRNA (adenine1518-N6/adenine1519-N6)-dimethyltransferase